ncbi:MAG TPA: 50S ribosomal protein L11 methyltransferase [Mycobacteriales bacterium]|nr:50S ribosomal protein L11 methyltransferase [Mycobacteriales bacterium]
MDPAELVLRRTRLQSPPAVPELRLHLADDLTEAWEDLERELALGALPPPFWAFAWVGGQALARYVLDHPAEVAGRRVLDLCTGSGLVALAARRAGAAEVTGVDVDPVAGAAVAANAAANDLQVAFRCADLTAGDLPDVDVLLAGDVCYDREMTDRVVPWLRAAAARGTRVLLGDPGRHYLPQQGLRQLAALDVPTTRDLEGVTVRATRVYAL